MVHSVATQQSIEIWKYHSMGEDFAVVMLEGPVLITDLPALSKSLCARRGLVGADGVALIDNVHGDGASARFFRPDGQEIDLSLTGLRCAGRHVADLVQAQQSEISTRLGKFRVRAEQPPFSSVKWYTSRLPTICRGSKSKFFPIRASQLWNGSIPELGTRTFFAVEVAEPHLITFPDKPMASTELEELGRKANRMHDHFPYGVNLSAVYLLDEKTIFLKTFGRLGLGLTMSRSSAIAAACYAKMQPGHSGMRIAALCKGGLAECVVQESEVGTVGEISSNCTSVFKAGLTVDSNGTLPGNAFSGYAMLDEISDFDDFQTKLSLEKVEKKYFTRDRAAVANEAV